MVSFLGFIWLFSVVLFKSSVMPALLEILQKGRDFLVKKGFSPKEADYESRFILSFLLGKKLLDIYQEKEVPPLVAKKFFMLLEKRSQGIPTAYLLGEVEFFGRLFKVGPGVLIPRPETEILVETALNLLPEGSYLLELGVGSGCISITLALERPSFKIIGVDISSQALSYTIQNLKRYGLEKKLLLVRGNWLSPFKETHFFNAILSNPPYVAKNEWETLDKEVKLHEPQEALLAGEEGLDFIAETLKKAPMFLKPPGYVILEIGYRQREKVASLAEKLGYKYFFVKDLSGHHRVLVAKYSL